MNPAQDISPQPLQHPHPKNQNKSDCSHQRTEEDGYGKIDHRNHDAASSFSDGDGDDDNARSDISILETRKRRRSLPQSTTNITGHCSTMTTTRTKPIKRKPIEGEQQQQQQQQQQTKQKQLPQQRLSSPQTADAAAPVHCSHQQSHEERTTMSESGDSNIPSNTAMADTNTTAPTTTNRCRVHSDPMVSNRQQEQQQPKRRIPPPLQRRRRRRRQRQQPRRGIHRHHSSSTKPRTTNRIVTRMMDPVQVDAYFPRMAGLTLVLWLGLVLAVYLVTPVTEYTYLQGWDQQIPFWASLVLGSNLFTLLWGPSDYCSFLSFPQQQQQQQPQKERPSTTTQQKQQTKPQRYSGIVIAAIVTLLISIWTNLLLAFAPTIVRTDPVLQSNVYVLRWCEWIPLSGLLTFLSDAVDLAQDDDSDNDGQDDDDDDELVEEEETTGDSTKQLSRNFTSSSSSSSAWSCWPAPKASVLPALCQMISTACGLGFPYCTNTTVWMVLQVTSWIGYLPIFPRVYRKRRALLQSFCRSTNGSGGGDGDVLDGTAVTAAPKRPTQQEPPSWSQRATTRKTTPASSSSSSFKNVSPSSFFAKEEHDRRYFAYHLLRQCATVWTLLVLLYYVHAIFICSPWFQTTAFLQSLSQWFPAELVQNFSSSTWSSSSSSSSSWAMWMDTVFDVLAKWFYLQVILEVHNKVFIAQELKEQQYQYRQLQRLLQTVWDSTSDTIMISVQGPTTTSTYFSPSILLQCRRRRQSNQPPEEDREQQRHANSSFPSPPPSMADTLSMGIVLRTLNTSKTTIGNEKDDQNEAHDDDDKNSNIVENNATIKNQEKKNNKNQTKPLVVLEAQYIDSSHISAAATNDDNEKVDIEKLTMGHVNPDSVDYKLATELIHLCWSKIQHDNSGSMAQDGDCEGTEEQEDGVEQFKTNNNSDKKKDIIDCLRESTSCSREQRRPQGQQQVKKSILLVHEFHHPGDFARDATTEENNRMNSEPQDAMDEDDYQDDSSRKSIFELKISLQEQPEIQQSRSQSESFVAIVRDVTERHKRFEVQRNHAADLARQKDAQTANRFTRHEIKNGLLSGIELCDGLQKCFEQIHSNILCIPSAAINTSPGTGQMSNAPLSMFRTNNESTEIPNNHARGDHDGDRAAEAAISDNSFMMSSSISNLFLEMQSSSWNVTASDGYGNNNASSSSLFSSSSIPFPDSVAATSPSGTATSISSTVDDPTTGNILTLDQQRIIASLYFSLSEMAGFIGQVESVFHEILDTVMADAMARDVMHECYVPNPKQTDLMALLKSSSSRIGGPRFPIYVSALSSSSSSTRLPKLMLDGQLLRFIHRNAISNAIKYGCKGGIVSTWVHYDNSDNQQKLSVKVINEPGPGHETLLQNAEQSNRSVFEAGVRLSNAASSPTHSQQAANSANQTPGRLEHFSGSSSLSSGDGAWIMQKCAKNMGGACSISFEPDQTVFEFSCSAEPCETIEHENKSMEVNTTSIVRKTKSDDTTKTIRKKEFALPPNTWALGIDDSWIQRKLLLRIFANAGIDPSRFKAIGKSLEEIETTSQILSEILQKNPDKTIKCLVLVDENLDYVIDEVGASRVIRSGSEMMQSILSEMPAEHRKRILTLVRSANDSSQDISIYRERTDGFFPKIATRKEDVMELLAHAWKEHFGEDDGTEGNSDDGTKAD